ncbi:hypothetical protein JCM19296_1492 [Nonlabens ulvanivorans]|uniref:Uncharacterized protein n=1 Tax=Nonlabens ulvanivorans TaxID=906888 RepID=A0A081DAE9_NONUL|nr:hypothetical protein JCM19296_1492 [Nonlabens ulvanivorans]
MLMEVFIMLYILIAGLTGSKILCNSILSALKNLKRMSSFK